MYCKLRGASIGCCHRMCRKAFHLTCGIKNNCLSEFIETFRSFCHIHHGIKKTKQIHKEDDLCATCSKEIGHYHPITSHKSICCGQWHHKICLIKKAHDLKDQFKCLSCGNFDEFRNNALRNGIYIPDR